MPQLLHSLWRECPISVECVDVLPKPYEDHPPTFQSALQLPPGVANSAQMWVGVWLGSSTSALRGLGVNTANIFELHTFMRCCEAGICLSLSAPAGAHT